jgi:hypothetical protein
LSFVAGLVMKSSQTKSFRAPPQPPKFLVVSGPDSSTSIVKIEKVDGNQSNAESKVRTTRSSVGLLPQNPRGSFKNSRYDAKGVKAVSEIPSNIFAVHTTDTYLGAKPRGAPTAAPKSVGRHDDGSFAHDPMLHNLSYAVSSSQRFDSSIPIGPDNPAMDLNETWSAYWDDAAGAVYYYNHQTGEATWIPPEL